MQNEKNGKVNKKFVIPLMVVALIILFDISIGGTVRFYSSWVECGQKPVVTRGSGFLNARALSYHAPPDISIFPGPQEYFCSPIEAERAGYSANPNQYDFPHLREAGEPNPLLKRFDQPKD